MLPIRVLIVDDYEVVRAGLRALLSGVDRVLVVGEAEDAGEAVTLADDLAPDVVVLDLRLGTHSGLDACRQIIERRPSTRVLVLSAYCDVHAAAEALSLGAAGFLLKRSSGRALIRAVKASAQSEAIVDAEVARRLSATAARAMMAAGMRDDERNLAQMIADGMTNAAIAARLGVPEASVKASLRRLFTHLGVAHRAEVAARLAEIGA